MIATVLVPTHEHGDLLERSVGSALAQVETDIEVFVVGDGATGPTRMAANRLSAADPRVRFFDNPKGPRHGEVHRHAALQHARGRIVCYLSDDDLWLPDHVSTMAALLDDADFAHAFPLGIGRDGDPSSWIGHLAVPASRRRVIDHHNFIPLSCGAHTLDAYRRLPHGWRTTPPEVATDVHMWAQFLAEPWVRAASGRRITVLHFPSPDRAGSTLEERAAELDAWAPRLTDARWRATFDDLMVDDVIADRADREMIRLALQRQLAGVRHRTEALEAQLEWMTGTLTWRIRAALLRWPVIGAVIRSVGRARARRAAR